MISILDKNNKLNEQRNSISVSYIRDVNIIFGHYPYPEHIHSFIINTKNNIKKELQNYTNVKGGMTDWYHFIDKKEFIDFTTYLINKHQLSHPEIFMHFFEKYTVANAWGNEIKKNDSLTYHNHPCFHGILYLSKGCDLILPELNLKITPHPGDYYIFPPMILHGFDTSLLEDTIYSLIFNIEAINAKFNYHNKIDGNTRI